MKRKKTPEQLKQSILKKWKKLTKKIAEYDEAKNGNS